jgi:hypothetical protein
VKLALKYNPRPKIAEGFIQRLSIRAWMKDSVLSWKPGKPKGVWRALFTPDEPVSEPAEEKAGVQPEQTKPAKDSVLPVPVKTRRWQQRVPARRQPSRYLVLPSRE